VRLLAGTSGYAFKEWKGSFYPSDCKDDAMLGLYAGQFGTVEINNTFYRLPKEQVLLDWAAQVPEPFMFAIKASQRITHYARLKPESISAVEFLIRNTALLGHRLGESWFGDDVFDVLRARDIALCITEQANFASPVVATASWGYARLHKLDYNEAHLTTWAQQIAAMPWNDAYVFFKHDEGAGSGPPAVGSFMREFGS